MHSVHHLHCSRPDSSRAHTLGINAYLQLSCSKIDLDPGRLTKSNDLPHFLRHSSPPVPGAMTNLYCLRSLILASGMPVAACSISVGTVMSEAQTVCVPGSRVAKFAKNEAFSQVGLCEKCMMPAHKSECKLRTLFAASMETPVECAIHNYCYAAKRHCYSHRALHQRS